jgi:hypothetical protein
LIQKIREAGLSTDIIFGEDSQNSSNPTLRDFFSMAQFDCLIRSESHYSIAAQLIGNHKLVISPSRFHSEINHDETQADLVIDQLAIFENGVERREDAEIRFPFISSGSSLEKYLKHHRNVFGLSN